MTISKISLKANLINKIKGELVSALIRTFFARAIMAIGTLFLVVIIGRTYGAEGVGIYALAQSIALGVATLSRYGMNNSLMRFVGQDDQSEHITTYLIWGCKRAFGLSLIGAFIIFLMRNRIEDFFNTPGLASVLTGIAIAIPPFTLAFLISGFLKGVRRPASACLLENGSIALVAGALILLINFITPEAEVSNVGWAYALAAWLVFIQGCCQIWSWKKVRLSEKLASRKIISRNEFFISSRDFFIMSLSQLLQTVVSVMVAGWLLSSSDMGLFKTSQQAASLISFVLVVINAIFPPRFARLYYEAKFDALNNMARRSALISLCFSFPLLLICLLFPHELLSLIGRDFAEAATLLKLIAIAQMINVTTGAVAPLLNMTGHEKIMRNISLISNITGLSMFFILIPLFGPLGAAVSLAIILVLQNLLALFFVWRLLGIWTLPIIPNPHYLSKILTGLCKKGSF